MSASVRVWDLPTRLFHWLLVASVLALVTTAQIGGAAMAWHFRFGYTVLSLLMFRIVWGLVGGRWSRFKTFLYSPATVLRYIKGQSEPEHSIGHNPLGAFSVFGLLGFLLLQVTSGLLSDDEIAWSGPLSKFVSSVLVGNATFYHKNVGKLLLIALVLMHIGAIVFYLVKKRENLVRPMIHGDKITPIAVESSRDDAASRALAALIFGLCAALVAGLVTWAG